MKYDIIQYSTRRVRQATGGHNKIWDVVQPRDNWERGYAHLAYEHTKLKQLFSKRIEVKRV